MLSGLMITRLSLRLATLVSSARSGRPPCQKVPLRAPSGSTIILTASNNAVAANGTVDLIAQVLSPRGRRLTLARTSPLRRRWRHPPADATTDINGQTPRHLQGQRRQRTRHESPLFRRATTGLRRRRQDLGRTAATGRSS